MKLIFRLRFHTQVGQTLFITGNHEILGGGRAMQAVPLQYLDAEFWQAILDLPDDVPDALITYNYILRNADGSSVQDWGEDRVIHPASFKQNEILIIDSWNHAGAVENAFYTEPFQKVLLKVNTSEVRVSAPPGATHTFKAKAPLLLKGQVLCLSGQLCRVGQLEHHRTPLLLTRIAGEIFLPRKLTLAAKHFRFNTNTASMTSNRKNSSVLKMATTGF